MAIHHRLITLALGVIGKISSRSVALSGHPILFYRIYQFLTWSSDVVVRLQRYSNIKLAFAFFLNGILVC